MKNWPRHVDIYDNFLPGIALLRRGLASAVHAAAVPRAGWGISRQSASYVITGKAAKIIVRAAPTDTVANAVISFESLIVACASVTYTARCHKEQAARIEANAGGLCFGN